MSMPGINWSWIKLRFLGECPHEWTTGDRAGHKACGRCGVWRWNPLSPKRDRLVRAAMRRAKGM